MDAQMAEDEEKLTVIIALPLVYCEVFLSFSLCPLFSESLSVLTLHSQAYFFFSISTFPSALPPPHLFNCE